MKVIQAMRNLWHFSVMARDNDVKICETEPFAARTTRVGILEAVQHADCLLVIGGRGSGKTHFMQCLARIRAAQGEEIIVIDPKIALPDKWPEGVRVIGSGHEYAKICAIAEHFNRDLESRKTNYSNLCGFGKLTVIIDEFFLLNLKIKGFADMFLPLLLEGREYGIHLALISQSDRAQPLGIKGKADLLECFDAIVHFNYVKNTEKRVVYANFGQGNRQFLPPPGIEEVENALCKDSGRK
jgi:hypothetical protein